MRGKRVLWGVGAGLLLAILAVGWWLGSPLFRTERVDEDFPAVVSEQAVATVALPTTEPSATVAAPTSGGTVASASEESGASPTAQPTLAPTTSPTPAGPVALLAGTFRDVDSVHQGSGNATIYRLADGSRTLRLESFEVTNGPDLYVLLVPRADPSEGLEGFVELAALKGNQGNQNYALPADVALDGAWSVVIWCKAFNVNFSIATLAAP